MVAAVDENGYIFEISNHLCRYLAKNKQDLIDVEIKRVFFADNEKQFDEIWQDLLSGVNWHGEIKVVDDHEAKWLGVHILAMQDKDYIYSGFRLLAQDITDKKSIEKISITDTLTGVLNRRSLEETLDRVTRLAQRNKEALSIAMLDVDYFKLYNDNYGHAAGDKVLVNISAVFSTMLARPNDYIFRVGGEEFIIIFNGRTAEASKQYLDKIRQTVNNLGIAHEYSKVDSCITVSIGGIFFDGKSAIDSQIVLSDADVNLYRAKETRNKVVQTTHGKPVVVNIDAKA